VEAWKSKTFHELTAGAADEPILLCVPTSTGKVCLLCCNFDSLIIALIETWPPRRRGQNVRSKCFQDCLRRSYEGLSQEMVGNFIARLKVFGNKVGELISDSQMAKQLTLEMQIIVTTLEKWTVITREMTNTSYPTSCTSSPLIKFIYDPGTSASLALRLHCPKPFFGLMRRKGFSTKQYQITNEVCYEKFLGQAGKNQTLVLVRSCKVTAKTTRFQRDTAIIEKETFTQFFRLVQSERS